MTCLRCVCVTCGPSVLTCACLSLTFGRPAQVMDSTTDRRLGHLQMEVKDLLREPQLEVHETPFQLKDSGPISKIILSVQLRVCTVA